MEPDIQLRDVTVDDIPALFLNEIDPESNRLAGLFPRDADAFKTHLEKVIANPDVIAKAILVNGEIAGDIGCFQDDTGEGMVGYRIAREFWGRGIATRALELMLQLVTRRPLHARVASHNKASIRVLEKCGFKVTGYEWCPATDRLVECEEALLVLR